MEYEFYDAFISYGRADSKAFAIQLQERLTERNLKIWFDQNDIPLAVDFQEQINDGIEKTDNFLFIISPHAVNSIYCLKEIELAIQLNKRIVPLLHVEQISQETWQHRYPTSTPADWEDYRTRGLHSSFPNMHPAIGKINWIYFREGVDDFEQSFMGLLKTFDRHRSYVRQHTTYLISALEWQRHQKQSPYLLIAEERIAAENWLKTRFQTEQPPCEPTDLHCEFITESIKNANNLMTQVFLSHAEADHAFTDKLRNTLMRECFTVWTSKTDTQSGVAFQEAIDRGIEAADTIVLILSPAALRSPYCQHEVQHAMLHHKRIIPLLVQDVDLEQLPPDLRSLQFINFTNHEVLTSYQKDTAKLLKALRQDASYYEQHKLLLAKALKWERQHRNPSILLRGYSLRHYESWLKVASGRSHHPPTPSQVALITESLRQPVGVSQDVFISYSRTDSDFARRLNDALQIQGKTTWFDQESIAAGADFQQEIHRGIANSDNFLFILSPSSIQSPYCADEVEYAAQLHKRCVTVLYRSIVANDLHPELARVQWIDFQHSGDFSSHFSQLIRTLETDREHVHSHTKWSQRAIEWEENARSEDLLLRGSELTIATNWLQEANQTQKQPPATELQQQLIAASVDLRDRLSRQEDERKRRQVRLVILALVATIGGVLALGFTMLLTFQTSQEVVAGLVTRLGRAIAVRTQEKVIDYVGQPLVAQRQIAEDMQNQTLDSDDLAALERQFMAEVQKSELLNFIYFGDTQGRFVGVSRDYRTGEIQIQRRDQTTGSQKLTYRSGANSQRGEVIAREAFDPRTRPWFVQTVQAARPNWSPVYTAREDTSLAVQTNIPIYDRSKRLKGVLGLNLALEPLDSFVKSLDTSPNAITLLMERSGDIVATSTRDPLISTDQSRSQVTRLSVSSPHISPLVQVIGRQLVPFPTILDQTNRVWQRSFTTDGKQFIGQVLPIRDQQGLTWFLLLILPEDDFLQSVRANRNLILFIAFGFLGALFLISGLGIPVYQWLLRRLHLQTPSMANASAGQQRLTAVICLLALGGIGVIVFGWWLSWLNPTNSTRGHRAAVNSVQFAATDLTALSGSDDGTLLQWQTQPGLTLFNQPVSQTIGTTDKSIRTIRLQPGEGGIVAAGLENGEIQLWDLVEQRSKPIASFQDQPDDRVFDLAFTSDGNTLFSGHGSGLVLRWDVQSMLAVETALIRRPQQGIAKLSFAVSTLELVGPNGTHLAIGGQFNQLMLWDLQSNQLNAISPHPGKATDFIVSMAIASTQPHLLATADTQGTIRLWNLTNCLHQKQPCQLLDEWQLSQTIQALALSADGCYLASSGTNPEITLWPLNQGRRATEFSQGIRFDGFSEPSNSLDIKSTPEGIWVLSGGETGDVRVARLDQLSHTSCDN